MGRIRWEYMQAVADGDGDFNLDRGDGVAAYERVDKMLAIWGDDGWELVAVTPADARLLYTFKRPLD